MTVVFEFLGLEPIENLITCMNFKVDKVIYFGYQDVIKSRKTSTEKFLNKYCDVEDACFFALSRKELKSVMDVMRGAIEKEIEQSNELYFDITGGEDLILVAFGILSKEFMLPMHMYDIENDNLIELTKDEGVKRISQSVSKHKIKLDLDRYIEMKGGLINHYLHKNIKDMEDESFVNDVTALWGVIKKYKDIWNPFSGFVRSNMIPDSNMNVDINSSTIITALGKVKGKLKTPVQLNAVLEDLMDIGVILNLKHTDGKYQFKFKSETIKELIWESGSVLELYTYQTENVTSDDCMVGVHLDWDGVIHLEPGSDVLNEIDVLSLRGNVPTFISCKSGKMGANQALHALYELETVAERFGGKYARKVLVTAQPLSSIYVSRAAEMGIEVR